MNEKNLPPRVNVRYLYQPGELEGGGRRATDPIWSLKVYNIERIVTKPDEPLCIICMTGPSGASFVRTRHSVAADIFVTIRQRVDAVVFDPALWVEWGKRCLV